MPIADFKIPLENYYDEERNNNTYYIFYTVFNKD